MANEFRRFAYGLVGRALRLRFGEEVPYLGTSMYAPDEWITTSTRARIFLKKYEKAESELVRKHLLPDVPVIELGCGIGVVSRQILACLDANTPFVGIEANPALADVANGNLERLKRRNCVINHAVIGAAADLGKKTRFAVTDGNFQFSSSDLVDKPGTTIIDVPVTTLSEVTSSAGWDEFQIVSDIEGAEREFLSGDPDSMKRCVQLVIELHDGNGYSIDSLKKQVESHGFRSVDQSVQTFVFVRDGSGRRQVLTAGE